MFAITTSWAVITGQSSQDTIKLSQKALKISPTNAHNKAINQTTLPRYVNLYDRVFLY
jgi:hypothetical protein